MHCEILVVGAGVVGLAVARALAQRGRDVVVVDAADHIGAGVSGRNSGVVHAGLYYPAGSLKAATCVEGRRLLYDYCATHGVPHRRLGKLVVATELGQLDALAALHAQALACGVSDVELLDAPQVHALEPALRAVGGLLSPSTGIVDGPAFMAALSRDARAAGAVIALRTRVTRLEPEGSGVQAHFGGDGLRADWLVNAAGLAAPTLVADLLPEAHRVRPHFAKGSYFALAGRAPFDRLVYPLPSPGGLGVHLTLDLAGAARFGPDVEWLDDPDPLHPDCTVHPARVEPFYAAIRAYWPGLPDGALRPDYAGVRPKLVGPGAPAADFRVDGPATHGVPGLINLLGIESPGLTAALALAERVSQLIR